MSGEAIFSILFKNKACELAIATLGFGLSLSFLVIIKDTAWWSLGWPVAYGILSLLVSTHLFYGAIVKDAR